MSEIPKLRRKLTLVFNKFIRLRDKDLPCISCGVGRGVQAGHYYSTSQCPQPSMRFNERNVNGQCIRCNHFQEGNRQGYRVGLRAKYGPKIESILDVTRAQKQAPWTRWEYEVMIKLYQKKVRELDGA